MNESASLRRKSGHDEVGPFLVELLELLLEGGEPEEPVLLALLLERDLVDRAGVVRPAARARS